MNQDGSMPTQEGMTNTRNNIAWINIESIDCYTETTAIIMSCGVCKEVLG